MNKIEYINNLSLTIKQQGHDEDYTSKCIQYAELLLDNNLPVIFDFRHFCLLTGVDIRYLKAIVFKEELFYSQYEIKKKSGGIRILQAPSLELKYIQRWILDNILKHMRISSYATGFSDNNSIVHNAKIHLGQECILNIDLENFFPSIKFGQVFKVFYYYGYTKEVSFLLSKICTYNNKLPQGSPASPALSNIVCLKLDKRLSKLAEKYDAKYSRYADDITFSGNIGLRNIQKKSEEILNNENFNINHKKTRISFKHQRQEVTGIIINNNKLSVNKNYKNMLKQEIYYCSKYGVQSHMDKINCNKSFYKEHLYGKAYFVNMVEHQEGQKILKLLDQIEWNY